MITNGNASGISQNNNLPQMTETIVGWFIPITFGVVVRTKNGVDWVETVAQIQTQGFVQELKGADLVIYPEGERGWDWLEVHCTPDLKLNVNEYVWYKGIKYKIRKKKDYTDYGYINYHLQEAYIESP